MYDALPQFLAFLCPSSDRGVGRWFITGILRRVVLLQSNISGAISALKKACDFASLPGRTEFWPCANHLPCYS
ncbi:hypothetical protein L596_018333 [Steinernema carpocapsae]|uniref:Uncharacterized protein n=1 Tax=Steinernema carpocapsae TaxID=34508 RepID=A0A4U5N4L9_STECR|nr:hypothetical protein L596_018333 [Steinernema carpocapsae]